jgi:orotate phosphoribosyltransferase-like protein
MAYPIDAKDKFVELKASGMTLAKAAEELGIAYNTAVGWEKALKERIETQKAIRIEELQEKYLISKEKRIELFGERLLAINEELKKRDLSVIPTPKLFEMIMKCMKALEAEKEEPVFLSDEEMERKRDERIFANNMALAEIPKKKEVNSVSAESKDRPVSYKLRWGEPFPAKTRK